MNVAQGLNVSASALVCLCAAVFIGVYHRYAPWRSTPIGRQLMAVAATIGLLGLYTVLITVWPEGCPATILRALRTAVLVMIAALMLRQARMVRIAQRADRAVRREAGRKEEDPDA
jgi:hypothetical protein